MLNLRLRERLLANWIHYHFAWLHFTSALSLFYRQDELKQLIIWSRRKKLNGVTEHYNFLLTDVEVRLAHKMLRYPQMLHLAKWVYCAATMLNPPSRWYAKGSAAQYSLRN